MLLPLTFPDILSYLVCRSSAYSFEQFKNGKSVEAHVQLQMNGYKDRLIDGNTEAKM